MNRLRRDKTLHRGSGGVRRVGIIGRGAIGGVIAHELQAGVVEGCALSGVLRRSPTGQDKTERTFDELIASSDIIVEAAGHHAVREHGARVIGAGIDLVVLSAGALLDASVVERFTGEGRILVSSGAIGGLDILKSAGLKMGFESVRVETQKPAPLLAANTTDAEILQRLDRGDHVVFDGSASEAARTFPDSMNIAATVGLATMGPDRTQVRVLAGQRDGILHRIMATGEFGAYEMSFNNVSSTKKGITSSVAPYAVLRALRDEGAAEVVSW